LENKILEKRYNIYTIDNDLFEVLVNNAKKIIQSKILETI